jgi:hypothetical protein
VYGGCTALPPTVLVITADAVARRVSGTSHSSTSQLNLTLLWDKLGGFSGFQ